MPGGAHENMKAWSPEEDTLIISMHESEGPKWSKIVQRLPGRTVSSVRNRWQRIEKGRKLRESGVESKNRCHACGQPKRGHVCYAKLNGGPQVAGVVGQPAVQGRPRRDGGAARRRAAVDGARAQPQPAVLLLDAGAGDERGDDAAHE